VVKEADALASAGYRVCVLGGAYAADLKQRDLDLAAGRDWEYRIAYDVMSNPRARLWLKTQRKLGFLLWRRLSLANRWQIFYGTGSLQRAVTGLNADLTIAHWEAALPAVIAQLCTGKQVGIDMEDWFSEDLLPAARASRPISLLKEYERRLLGHGVHSSCTSDAMAEALVERYGCRRPLTIRNVFPEKDRESIDGQWKDRPGLAKFVRRNEFPFERPAATPVSIHWYSQTVGPGRGLEDLIVAAGNLAGDFEIHLRGESEKYRTWLDGLLDDRLRGRLHLHPLAPNDELLSRIAEHDVGFAGEQTEPLSRNLTITNKFFQYLQGGLAVVASATAGQKEGAREATGAVTLYEPGDVDGLRDTLQRLINKRDKLHAMRSAAWEAGARLCWENEAPKLVESVDEAIGIRREAMARGR
jgi:glycosyltransferase involved in cell wall biosynthesis